MDTAPIRPRSPSGSRSGAARPARGQSARTAAQLGSGAGRLPYGERTPHRPPASSVNRDPDLPRVRDREQCGPGPDWAEPWRLYSKASRVLRPARQAGERPRRVTMPDIEALKRRACDAVDRWAGELTETADWI